MPFAQRYARSSMVKILSFLWYLYAWVIFSAVAFVFHQYWAGVDIHLFMKKKRGEGRKRASHYFRWCICHGRPCRRYLSREWAAEFRDSLIIAARIGRSPYNWNGWHRLIRPWWRTWNASICDPSTHLSFRLMDSSTSFFSSSNSTQESQPTVDGRLFSLIAFPFAGVVLFFVFFCLGPSRVVRCRRPAVGLL